MAKLDEWIAEAPAWLAELDARLHKKGGEDVWIPYHQVARAFPDREPHPAFFDHPKLDGTALLQWAAEKGWVVESITEGIPKSLENMPPVRFIKKKPQTAA